MPRLLAIEWDSREIRVAVAGGRAAEMELEEAFSLPLTSGDEPSHATEDAAAGEDAAPPPPSVGALLAEALSARKLRFTEALVAVGRSGVELKQLSLPPVPDDELPEMVRWQAARDFHSLTDEWLLDFVPLAAEPDQPRKVLAAGMSPAAHAQFQQVCQQVGLKPTRLALRPGGTASLFLRRPEARGEQVRLLIDILADEIDMAVLVGPDVVFLRTARLRGDAVSTHEGARPLLGEIRRTLAAAHNQLGERRVEAIYLCGTATERGPLVELFQQELNLPVRAFDPLEGVRLSSSLRKKPLEHVGRYAALLGLLADELDEARPAIDFLHPRRRPPAPSHRNSYTMAGVAVAVVVALVSFWLMRQLAALDEQIQTLSDQLKALDPVVAEAAKIEKSVEEINKWTASDVVWLDELRELSQEFPEPKDAMLTSLTLSAHPEGGTMKLDGLVRDAGVVDTLEQGLRDEQHSVEGQGRQQDPKQNQYRWQFNSLVLVKPRPQEANSASVPAHAAVDRSAANPPTAEAR